jgi:Uma2 family endonuclease
MRHVSRVPDRIPPGPIKLTYEDYVELPDDGRRYEILDGELEVSPAPAPLHQRVSQNLSVALDAHVRPRRLGRVYCAPVDVLLADTTIVQPDLVFISAGREAIVTKRAVEGPPELVVEILSPWSVRRDRVAKATLYARFGIGHYWLLDPEARGFEVYEADGTEYRLVATHGASGPMRTPLFPELELDLALVWE